MHAYTLCKAGCLALGVLGLVIVAQATELRTETATEMSLDLATLSKAQSTRSCTSPFELDYMQALEAENADAVYFAGCGVF